MCAVLTPPDAGVKTIKKLTGWFAICGVSRGAHDLGARQCFLLSNIAALIPDGAQSRQDEMVAGHGEAGKAHMAVKCFASAKEAFATGGGKPSLVLCYMRMLAIPLIP